MASEVDLCNIALNSIGHKSIQSLNDKNSEAAIKCNVFLQPCIDAVLRSYNWNCATRRISLAMLTETPAFGFSYCFQLPDDCLRVLSMSENYIAFKVEGRKLLCNETEAKILYISRIPVPEMDSQLLLAVADRLATRLAYPLSNSKTLQDLMDKIAQGSIIDASCTDAQEGTPDDPIVDDLLNARL